jgi:hypothetical protein
MLKLALALQEKLEDEIPALIDEINAEEFPEVPIVPPIQVLRGVRTEMLQRDLSELPSLACGIYVRANLADDEGQQEFSSVSMPYVIDVYLGNESADNLYIQAHKWALVLDLFVERHASDLLFGYLADEAPDIDISYVLSLRDGTYRQLVSATGFIDGTE